MKVTSIVGTRPNFVKEYALKSESRRFEDIEWTTIHTGQHYDYEMSQAFFDIFDLPRPDYHLNIGSGSLCYQRGETIKALEPVLKEISPDVVLLYGDVNATMAGAIAARSLNLNVAHIEGGIYTKHSLNPEEINRTVADALSDVIFCVLEEHCDALRKKGYPEESIIFSGDLHYDVFLRKKKHLQLVRNRSDYILVTVHRQENRTRPEALRNIVEALLEIDSPIIWPVHPATREQLKKFGLEERMLAAPHISLIPPLDYVEFTKVLKDAKYVLTDSGGVRREAYFWKIPTLILVEINWFKQIEALGWKRTVGPHKERILQALQLFNPQNTHDHKLIFGSGNAAETILKALIARFGHK